MRYRLLPALVSAGVLCCAQGAYAATLTVDDDRADCPAAAFTSVQAAVDAAAAGDTIVICKGDYVEGTGTPGTNALTITKQLTLKGAGADLVTITPKASSVAGGSILEDASGPAQRRRRHRRDRRHADAAAHGRHLRRHRRRLRRRGPPGRGRGGHRLPRRQGLGQPQPRDERRHLRGRQRLPHPGGWRGAQPGVGIVQTSTALLAPVDGSRKLEIDAHARRQVQPDRRPDRRRAERLRAVQRLRRGQLGRHHREPDHRPHGVRQLRRHRQLHQRPACVTTGPLFGQDGLRVTTGAYATVDSSLISQNLVNGDRRAGARHHRQRPDEQRQPQARRGHPLRRRAADELLERDRARRQLARPALEHRRQRLRRAQRDRRRRDGQRRPAGARHEPRHRAGVRPRC